MKRQKGFTLLEIVLATMLLGISLFGFSKLYSTYIVKSKVEVTKDRLRHIQLALINFVKVNGFLPCPDATSPIDGIEDRKANGACARRQGRLPWKTLGVAENDGWGNHFYYRVPNGTITNGFKVKNPCETASVFGRSGPATLKNSNTASDTLYLCKTNARFYCNALPTNCVDSASLSISDFKTLLTSYGLKYGPPYVTWFTPPVGGGAPLVSQGLKIYTPAALGTPLGVANDNNVADDLVQVLVLSFGKNGRYVWNGATNGGTPLSNATIGTNATNDCSGLTQLTNAEKENCNGDPYYIFDPKSKEDFMVWLNLYDIKAALFSGGGY